MKNPLRWLFGADQVERARAEVEAESARIQALAPEAAERAAGEFLARRARMQGWGGGAPRPTVEARLGQLDARVARLLREQRRYEFPDTGTVLGAEFLETVMSDGSWQIGDNRRDGYQLGVRPGSPIIYEIPDLGPPEQFSTIDHYILELEDGHY